MKAQRSGRPAGKPAREDRRIRRTRDLLEQSLLSLIKEKPFDSISVQDIADRANIGRATFYLHYQNKEDLLGCGFAGLQSELREYQRAVRRKPGDLDESFFAFSRYLLEHAHKHREIFPAMVGKRGGAIQHVLRRLLTDLMREEVTAKASELKSSTLSTQATIEFLSSGLYGLLVWWLNGRARISAEEMNDIFRRLAIPVLNGGMTQRDRRA